MPRIYQQSNFSQLKARDEQLDRLGLLAEGMAQSAASQVSRYTSADEMQIDLPRRLQDYGIMLREVVAPFREILKEKNDSNHDLAEYQWLTRPSVLGVVQRLAIEVLGSELVPQDTNNEPTKNLFTLCAARTHHTRQSVGEKANTV